MVWHEQISLKDADYFLYVFDTTGRIGPGSNPRVLGLFDLRDHLKAWAQFEGQADRGYSATPASFSSTIALKRILSYREPLLAVGVI